MLNWEEVKENTELLKRVEELVESVCNINYDFPQEVCDELNRLTENQWEGSEYINYCAEYWESKTLEETVWALFHDGNLPDLKEYGFRIKSVSGKFSQDNIIKWFTEYFKTDWEQDYWEKYVEKNLVLNYIGEREYGYEQKIGVYLRSEKNGFISTSNISEENKEAIIRYFSENEECKVVESGK